MNSRSWFRITVDDSGKVIDCKPVSSEGTDALGVYYRLANSAKEAAVAASKSHEARLLAARRARYEAQGLCKCGRKRDRPNPAGGTFKACSGCDERHQVHVERKRAKDRGETVPPLDRRAVLLERKETEGAGLRLGVLEEVRDAWRKYPTVGGFTRWIEQEIAKLAGKKVA